MAGLAKDKSTTWILGIDIGTSGVRGCLVCIQKPVMSGDQTNAQKKNARIVFEASVSMPSALKTMDSDASIQASGVWTQAFEALFTKMAHLPDFRFIEHIVADATSSSVLLCNAQGQALTKALMYDDQQAHDSAQKINKLIAAGSFITAATGAQATLAKTLFLMDQLKENHPNPKALEVLTEKAIDTNQEVKICHQIDWFNQWLTGTLSCTDENNALKLGYDPINQAWPNWVVDCLKDQSNLTNIRCSLPKVVKPGDVIATVSTKFAQKWQLNHGVKVHAGTTDSIAGFLASGASQEGDAVTSLGSTMAVKMIVKRPIFNKAFGVYSHRLGHDWLVGGASNSGGAVLLKYFNLNEIKQSVSQLCQAENAMAWQTQSNPGYYPLSRPGERFPIANPTLQPILPELPELSRLINSNKRSDLDKPDLNADDPNKKRFLLGLIQGLANVEQLSYRQLETLGASPPRQIFSVGGGTQNAIWMYFRNTYLTQAYANVQFSKADSLNAAFGVTRLVSEFFNPVFLDTLD